MMDRDLSRTTIESFLLSIASLRRTDLRPNLDKINVPVMGMYGDKDNIVNPMQWRPLESGVGYSHTERFPKAGHFIMLDEPQPFINKLKSFLLRRTPGLMIKAVPTYYFPNRLGRIMLVAFGEVINGRCLNALLNISSLSNFIDNHTPDDEIKDIKPIIACA